MSKVDPNEAPEGYMAVADGAANACDACDIQYFSRLCMTQECCFDRRKDGCNVRYRKRQTAIWPYYSEGTPV